MKPLDKDFWTDKYLQNETGWDIGYISTPIKEYIDQLSNKNLRILIPGCGNSYEAEYLINKGFTNVFVIDLSYIALENIKKRVKKISENQLICGDFFKHQGKYDLILEQTFFCAISPNLRKEYANQMHKLLNKEGKLVGLLFNNRLNNDSPPFGGNKEEYLNYFKPFFNIVTMETAYNSIKSRKERELFINLLKK